MSVITWDGKVLATDRQICTNNMSWKYVGKKLIITEEYVFPWSGTQCKCLALIEWYKNSADPAKFPDFQKTEEWQRLIVLHRKTKNIWEYENIPIAVLNENIPNAWGSGAEFAIGAMAMGADAVEAVKIAIKFDPGCGFGVDWYDSETEKDGQQRIINVAFYED